MCSIHQYNRALAISVVLACGLAYPCHVLAQRYIDSLETKLVLVDNDQKLKILDELIPYYFRNEPLKAQKKAEKMKGLAMQAGNRSYEVKAERFLGLIDSHLTSDHEEALKKCMKAESNARANGFTEEQVLSKLAIASIFYQIGNTTKALEHQLAAYHLSDSMDYKHLHSIILNDQARSYIELEAYEKAELCLKNSLNNAKMIDQREMMAETNMMFGALYQAAFNYEIALTHFENARTIFASLGKELQTAMALYEIGNTYFALDNWNKSFEYHLKALHIRIKINDYTGLAESYNEIGHWCTEREEFGRAIKNLELGLTNAELVNSNRLMQQSFNYLYWAYLGAEDYKNAALYQNKYSNISELIHTEASERKIQEITTQNEIERRELQIRNLQEREDRKEEQLAMIRKFSIVMAVLLLFIAVSLFFVVRSYRSKRRINKKLEEINARVIKQNEALSKLNGTKDKFFSIIGHDLKGPLNSLTAFSQLLINHTASLTEEEIKTIAKDLDKSLKNLYELLENLLAWARSQTGNLEFVPLKFRIAEVIKENVRLLSKAAQNKRLKIEMLVDDDLEIYADLNSIKTVIRNLLSNAIKFTPSEGVISIFADRWKDRVEIAIRDTGVGMSEAVQQKIFDISSKHTSLGTNKEKGTGLGLVLCKEFVEANKGKLMVESTEGAGSLFKIVLPNKVAKSREANAAKAP
jgi:signal transduction histidine kinase